MEKAVKKEFAFIALGSNLNQPKQQLSVAIEKISDIDAVDLISTSSFYETTPVGGPLGQPNYINAVICIKTSLQPIELLTSLQDIEHQQGRVRFAGEVNMPRTIDLDILLFGERKVSSDVLKIPHPRMHIREFVLLPLKEIAPLVYEAVISNQWPWLKDITLSCLKSGSSLKDDEARVI